MANNVVLITGAGGWLGGLLAHALHDDLETPNVHLILTDVVQPKAPDGAQAITIKADLTDTAQVDALFKTEYGVPDTIYCLHGIMSRGSEDNFELGVKVGGSVYLSFPEQYQADRNANPQVNVDSVRSVLDAARHHGAASARTIKLIFTSSLAVYGGPLPSVVTPNTLAAPESAYGMGKLVVELFINEYTRRGFIDGRIIRLPTIVIRPGAPSAATSAFISGIVREPLKGLESICPIGTSFDSPALDLALWVASPETTIKNFLIAKRIPADKFLSHTRVVCLPGFTTTVRQELEALAQVGGAEAVERVKFVDDPTNRRVVSSWPARFDNSYALGLGFVVDVGGMIPIVHRFKHNLEAGIA
ncbi:hypothetical protein A0H81_06005 [Grifola frondosa]|uniref:NAD-dependent epimerase/dehydratase domain-containing protein n=1 Tax=Grifola frondosa TaxID=5627 RepID=A0A1C7MA32_GRIFR|nr:hypothetical protein A0H81_06005 [Grifola frondosa]